VCLELREKANEDPTFISRIILVTGDESWIYGYDPETKQQSSQWKSPQLRRTKTAWQVRISTKSMLIVFSDVRRIVHREFVIPNTAISSDFYCESLERTCATKKTGTLAQPQLAPSSRQRVHLHVPENHRVCD
jgi:hypothetical protein